MEKTYRAYASDRRFNQGNPHLAVRCASSDNQTRSPRLRDIAINTGEAKAGHGSGEHVLDSERERGEGHSVELVLLQGSKHCSQRLEAILWV